VVSNRNSGTGCPYCAGRALGADNCLQTLNPSLAAEWHPVENGSFGRCPYCSGMRKLR
jgi:uncharacterized Zn-finger protein